MQQFVQAIDNGIGEPVVQARPAHDGVGAFFDHLADQMFVGFQCLGCPFDDAVEHRNMPPLLYHGGQQLAKQGGNIQLVQLFADRAFRNPAKPFIIQRSNNVAHQARCPHSHPAFAARWCAQEFAHCTRHIHALHTARNDFGGQKIGTKKAGEGTAKPFLVVGNNRGMRYGDTQRMPEKRGDGKPVGKSANHSRFGKCPQKSPMALIAGFHIIAGNKQNDHEQ